MAIKDILALVTRGDEDSALNMATALAARFEAHLAVACLNIIPDTALASAGGFAPDATAEMLTIFRGIAAENAKALKERARTAARTFEVRSVQSVDGLAGATAAAMARYADLTVMGQPVAAGADPVRRKVFEAALFDSGRPVLLAPEGWSGEVGKRVLVAWNASREAARALADAMPLIEGAQSVAVVTVDATPSMFGHGDIPGADIAAHLSRKGLKVDVQNIDGLGRSDAQAITDHAAATGADLIVMGGYGHARMLEFVFGGVTRELAAATKIPLLLSH